MKSITRYTGGLFFWVLYCGHLYCFLKKQKDTKTAKTHVFHALCYILEAVRCCSILLFHFAPKRIRPPPYPICEFLWKSDHRSPYFFFTEIITAPPPGAADQPFAYVVGLPSISMSSLPSTCRWKSEISFWSWTSSSEYWSLSVGIPESTLLPSSGCS